MPQFRARTHWGSGWILVLGLLAFAGGVAGCNRKQPRVKVYPCMVEGKITLAGAPLPKGALLFIPEASEEEGGRPGVATISRDGTYWVGNANHTKPAGLKPGRYAVQVLAAQPLASEPAKFQWITPAVYAELATTPLRANIKPGINQLDFELAE